MVGRATIITADWRSETSAMITENERKKRCQKFDRNSAWPRFYAI